MDKIRKNLWGEIPKPEHLRTPYTILKEQAAILSNLTEGLLIGEVIALEKIQQRTDPYLKSKQQVEKEFFYVLRIKVPALNNYTYSIVQISYPIELYPILVKKLVSRYLMKEDEAECHTEEQFEEALQEILSSREVKHAISVLLSQVREGIAQ
ncbi:MAG: hypothetical protein AB4290_27465 [Spirulina sp.]